MYYDLQKLGNFNKKRRLILETLSNFDNSFWLEAGFGIGPFRSENILLIKLIVFLYYGWRNSREGGMKGEKEGGREELEGGTTGRREGERAERSEKGKR